MKSEAAQLDNCHAARIERSALAVLAPFRHLAGIRIVEAANCAWVLWEGALPSVIQALQSARDVTFYSFARGRWRPIHGALPSFTVPNDKQSIGIAQAVLPEPVVPILPPPFAGTRVAIKLVPCSRPNPATALRCSLGALGRWIETATTHDLEKLRSAICQDQVWLCGARLPALPGAERYWGRRVLSPLGLRPEPDWPEDALCAAAIVDPDEILVLTREGAEVLPTAALGPITRRSVRLAMDEVQT